jgi:hypothetical protein
MGKIYHVIISKRDHQGPEHLRQKRGAGEAPAAETTESNLIIIIPVVNNLCSPNNLIETVYVTLLLFLPLSLFYVKKTRGTDK